MRWRSWEDAARSGLTCLLLVVAVAALAGCRGDSTGISAELVAVGPLALQLTTEVDRFTDWSAPVNLGPPVNTTFVDQAVSISRDGLSLYFHSNRPGGFGGQDIYVSQRASVNDPWGAPQNLGANINTSSNENVPRLSLDGHRLFFNSNRPGGFGGADLYLSRRRDERDDFGWQAPVNLGGGVNTTQDEVQANPFEDDATGTNTLYYASGPPGSGGIDIYGSTLLPDETYGPGVLVAELNSSSVDRQPAIRRDGLEIFLASDRSGTFGSLDLWVATRASTSDPWSTPVNLGPLVNTTLIDANPGLSFDGTTLYFQSTRPGGLGPCDTPSGPCVFDLWVTTRSKLEEPD